MHSIPDSWHNEIASVVDAIGLEQFPQRLIEALKTVIAYNQVVVICMQKECPPTFWCSEVPQQRKEAVIDQYLRGCYLLDPWYHAYQNGLQSGPYILEDIAPDNFYNSDFYHQYYQAISVDNEAVIAVNLEAGVQIQISLGLTEKQISQQTRNTLETVSPFIISAARKHWQDIALHSDLLQSRNQIINNHVAHVLENFGCQSLSEREREVALLMIRGYSLKAIADLLGVAMGTTKVHCKNLYKKLDINSQSELFSLFLDEISLPYAQRETQSEG